MSEEKMVYTLVTTDMSLYIDLDLEDEANDGGPATTAEIVGVFDSLEAAQEAALEHHLKYERFTARRAEGEAEILKWYNNFINTWYCDNEGDGCTEQWFDYEITASPLKTRRKRKG